MSTDGTVRVWDALVRILHLGFITGVAAAWFTRHASGPWHEWIGYAVMATLALRLLWGFAGPPSAQFRRFVLGPAATLRYAHRLAGGHAPRYLGHNPLGANHNLMCTGMGFQSASRFSRIVDSDNKDVWLSHELNITVTQRLKRML